MKIMIGVDDSACSQAALDFVCKLRWPEDTAVTVVSSVELPASAYLAAYVPAALQFDEWLGELTKFQKEVVARDERTLRHAGIKVESRVLQGDPRETLIEEAKKDHVDLLVVGSHGRTGFDKLMMGSVASHVVTHSPCSVLVVKNGRSEGPAR
jgi:nucleotide-binding universal stress UspA family protein